MKEDVVALIAEVRELDAGATKPWTAKRSDCDEGTIDWMVLPPHEGATVAWFPEDCQQDGDSAKHNATLAARYRTLAPQLADACERLRVCCEKVSGIRNSIIGAQGFSWSEHAYPLAAALDAAGFKGLPYPEAKANVGTLIERAEKAEAEVKELRRVLRGIRDYAENGVVRSTADAALGKEPSDE